MTMEVEVLSLELVRGRVGKEKKKKCPHNE
jgi:hypothetical protein